MAVDFGELTEEQEGKARTAGEAGWHVSRYNLMAPVPGTKNVAVANLFKGNCAEYTPLEMYLLSVVEELDEHHPIIERFARRGVIANFDERAALEAMGRAACAVPSGIGLTICPTMGCNFDCPYCFEDHFAGTMSAEVQDDVVAFAGRMLDASGTKNMSVTWFGGEPLLAPDVIESLSGRLMALVDERGGKYSASLITNGYLLTQKIADMLGQCKVKSAQVTIDGLGDVHDATRHLAGGGPTFERITSNLRSVKLPFCVDVRHNVHEGNLDQMDALEKLVGRLAHESGNDLRYYPSPVTGSEAADRRGEQVGLLRGECAGKVSLRESASHFRAGRGYVCGAHSLYNVGIDDEGRLQKCWESIDKPAYSFGTAHDWDPANPLATASNPNNLTMFLNTAAPVDDDECRACVWLPLCVGGCPYRRLTGSRTCLTFKDDPQGYVLALYSRMTAKTSESREPRDERTRDRRGGH